MGNTRHPDCAIRELARTAKARLSGNRYAESAALPVKKGASPAQREMCRRVLDLIGAGEEIVNPIAQLADRALIERLPYEERQRYIIRLAADYAEVRRELAAHGVCSPPG